MNGTNSPQRPPSPRAAPAPAQPQQGALNLADELLAAATSAPSSQHSGARRPAPDLGKLLVAIARKGNEELALYLSSYEGKSFLRICVVAKNDDGDRWPIKGKTVTVRLHELPDVAKALVGLLREGPGSQSASTSSTAPSRRPWSGGGGR